MLSNVSVSCGSSSGCSSSQSQMPPNGNGSNEDFSAMSYVDVDNSSATFMSSSDSLDLDQCSEVLWAGLYWSAEINSSVPGFSTRNTVKMKVNNAFYMDITADEMVDAFGISHPSYHCFKDITSLVQLFGGNNRYTIANVVTENSWNVFGGWTIVVVYRNIYNSMRNLTVFDGFGNIGLGNSLDIPITGFNTPLSGPVNFELGVVAFEGDRGASGDQLRFNGAGNNVQISDALHPATNLFNSTISYGAVVTPYRNPSLNNTLGYDAAIFLPDNSSFNYIGNNANSATIRVQTSSENILCRVLTSAIDIYEPDLRASVYIDDLNGGLVAPGDILEYTLVGKNIGSDLSINTFIVDTLDPRTAYVPNSISIDFGPNSGAKTDASGDDQAEYDPVTNSIKVRVGTGADAINGGEVSASSDGVDSTVVKFLVTVVDDCLMFQCDSTLEHVAYIFGEGSISGNPYTNDGASDLLDANGCPLTASNSLSIDVSGCPPPEITYNPPVCEGDSLELTASFSAAANYNWFGPNSFTSTGSSTGVGDVVLSDTGIYSVVITFPGLDCFLDTSAVIEIHENPIISLSAIQNSTCFQSDDAYISTDITGETPLLINWSNGGVTDSIGSLSPGEYILNVEDANTCISVDTFTVVEPDELVSNINVLTDFNGFHVSCYGDSNALAQVFYSGGTSPYLISWSNGDTLDVADTLSFGTYDVLVTDTNNCQSVSSISIIQPDSLDLTLSPTNISCFGGDDGILDLTVSGGVPDYIYDWSIGEVDEDIDTLTAGDYTVFVTDLNGCLDSISTTLTEPIAPVSLEESHVDVGCFGESTGSIDVSVAGGTPPYTYLWSNSATTEDLSDLIAGTYSLTVTDSLGCTEFLSVDISEPLAPLSVILSPVDVLCTGDSTGSIDALVSGGTASYTYLWSNGETTEDITNLPSGNYTLDVTDDNGCDFTITTPVIEPLDSLSVDLVSFDADCFGAPTGSILGSAAGGTAPYSYLWSNGETTDDLANLIAGVYTITVTDDHNCVVSVSDTVNHPDEILLSDTPIDVLCFGESTGSIDLSVTGGVPSYSFVWSNGETTEDINDIPAGIYDVDVFDDNGCLSEHQVEIIEPLAPIALSESHTDALCIGGSQGTIDLSVTGGTPAYSILWNNDETSEDIIDLVAGTYTAQVTDDHGCIDSLSIEILDPSNTMELSVSETDVLCFANNTGEIDLTVMGGAEPYSFDWSNAETTEDLTGLLAGNYFVIVQDNNLCESFISGFIEEPDAPISAIDTLTHVLCSGDSTGVIFIEASGGTAPYTYLWDNGETTTQIDSLPIGDYTLTVTDDHLCTQDFTYTITSPSEVFIDTAITLVSCFGGDDGAIDTSPSGGIPPYTYLWNTGETTQDIDTLVFGNYTLTITDSNECITQETFLVDQPATPVAITNTSGNISCFGGNDGFIDITVSGGNGGYVFDWSNAAVSEDLTDLFIGVYIVEVQDSKGCIDRDTIELTQPLAPLSLTTEMTPVICFSEANGTATVVADGGTAPYSYLWSNGETTSLITGLIIGDYSVVVTDSLGCVDSVTVTVTEPPLLTATADSIDVLCFGDSTGSVSVLALGGVGGYEYLWSTTDTTATVNNLPAGSYTVTVNDANGCTSTASTSINQPDTPLTGSLVVVDNLCFGESFGSIDATINGGVLPYVYSWSNGETTQDIDSLANGSYTLTVTDSNLCVLILDTLITSPSEVTITHIQTNVSCFGGSDATIDLTVVDATPPFSYLWNTADTTQDLDSLSVGVYDVIITDSNACQDVYTVTITEPLAPLQLSADSINVACFGDSTGSIDLSVIGGTPGYAYSWSNGDTLQDLSNIPTGSYQVFVTDTNACMDSLTMFIDQPLAPIELSATQVDILCFGDFTGEIDLTVTGGTPAASGYVYDWNNGGFADEDLADIPSGTYAVLVTDSLLCSDSLTITLTQPLAPIDIEFDILNVSCFGDSTGTVSAAISGGTLPYTWSWDLPITDTTLFIDSLPAEGYILNVVDSNGCIYSETAVVNQPSGPLSSAYADVQPSCFGYSDGSLTLIPSGGTPDYSYLWNTGDTTLVIDSLTTGNYSVEILDALGCYFTMDIFLEEPPELQISFDVDSLAGCSPFSVSFTNTSNATADCQWDFGDGNTFSGCEDVVNVYEEGGVYTVSLTAYDDNGCFNDVTYNDFITVYQTPTAAMNIEPQILYPETPTTNITNTSEGASMYVWNLGDSPQDNGFFEPGEYTYSANVLDTFIVTLMVVSDEGCTDSTSSFVVFNNDPFFFAPNTFTPDGNNLNEVWIPVFSSPDDVDQYNLQIYNRWGQLIFETDQVTYGWNGMVENSGDIAQDGVYTWKMTFKWYDQRSFQQTGHLNLLK